MLLTVFVAHVCAKPLWANKLHGGPLEICDTTVPFVIHLDYVEKDPFRFHRETYFGAFGVYWLYSHRIQVVLVCY